MAEARKGERGEETMEALVVEAEEWITRREASEIADVHMNTIRLWEQSGRITTKKAGNGMVLIPRHEIEGRSAEVVADSIVRALDVHCATPTSS